MKQNVKKLIFALLNLIFNREVFLRRPAILMYHSVGENSVFFTVRPSEFKKQMDYLFKNKFNVVPLEYLVNALSGSDKIPTKTVALTFDDGYMDNYENVFPILKKCNFPATIFVATGLIGHKMDNSYKEPLDMLDWEKIKTMHNSGMVSIEPHTHSHKKLAEVSGEEAVREIELSKREIEEKLNKKCSSFAYPHGSYDESTKQILREYGFRCAVETGEGLVGTGTDLFSLNRNSIDKTVGMEVFKGKLGYSNVLYQKLKKYLYV